MYLVTVSGVERDGKVSYWYSRTENLTRVLTETMKKGNRCIIERKK